MLAYQDMVFSTAVRLLGSEAEAQDIAQEVFLKAYDRVPELSLSATAGGWLKTVARNLCLNHLGRYRARWRFFSEMIPEGAEESAPLDWAGETDVQQEVEAGDRKIWIERCLQKLPPTQRVPLVLYHFEDLSYEEISVQLGISLAKVKTDIFRARDALRRVLRIAIAEDEHGLAPRTNGGGASGGLGASPLGSPALSPDPG